MVLEDAMTMNG